MAEWRSVGHGLQYRLHPRRKHGIGRDRYYRGRYTVDGKTVTVAFGWASEGHTQEQCLKDLLQLKENARKGEGPASLREKRKIKEKERASLERERTTLSDYFDNSYLPVAKISKRPSSVKAETIIFNKWIRPNLGGVPFKNITALNIERLKKTMLKAGKSPRTIEYTLAVVRQVWNMARRDGITDRECPVKQVKKVRFDNRRLRFLTHQEAETLLDALRVKSRQTYEIALLSLHCGLRFGEIVSLTWQDVDLEQRLLTLRDTKNTRSRVAFMTERVRTMLTGKHNRSQRGVSLVFTDNRGKRLAAVSKTFMRTVDELGLNNGVTDRRQKVVFHTLRHSFASWLVQEGENLFTVKELLGHRTIAMTQRYSHLSQGGLRAAAQRFDMRLQQAGEKLVINEEDKGQKSLALQGQ